MSKISIEDIRKKVQKSQNSERYEHTVGVMYTATALAMRYDENIERALVAGLLHDCAKGFSGEKKIKLCEKNGLSISETERENPGLLHAKLGAYLAEKEYGINDEEIKDAIFCHTTGKPDMTMLDKILFIADYIEPNRNQAPNLEQIRQLAARQLPIGDFRDSVDRMVEAYKLHITKDYIYSNPRSGYAYYALFQRINGVQLFNPESSREDVRVYGAVATSWDMHYPHSLRTTNLHNIAMRGMRNTRRTAPMPIPEELVSEVTLLDLALPDMRGATHRLTDLKGKVVLLDFTVYQNQASSARNRALRELYTKYAGQGLEIYQVAFDADEHFWKTSADNLPWICVRDVEGKSAQTYRVNSLPTYFLIDRTNSLYKRNTDIKDTKALETEIEKLLKQ